MSIVHRDAMGRIVARAAVCLCGNFKPKKRRMCATCEADPLRRSQNLYQMEKDRERERVDAMAERETRNLPKGDPLVPVVLNRLIDEWGRQ